METEQFVGVFLDSTTDSPDLVRTASQVSILTQEELNRSLAIDAVHGTAAPNSGVLAVNPTAQRFPKCTHEEWACPPAVSIPF